MKRFPTLLSSLAVLTLCLSANLFAIRLETRELADGTKVTTLNPSLYHGPPDAGLATIMIGAILFFGVHWGLVFLFRYYEKDYWGLDTTSGLVVFFVSAAVTLAFCMWFPGAISE
jgi:hypothetical protein